MLSNGVEYKVYYSSGMMDGLGLSRLVSVDVARVATPTDAVLGDRPFLTYSRDKDCAQAP